MAIKVCIKQVAFRCQRTSTIQPRSSSTRISWICPACAAFLREHPEYDLQKFPYESRFRRLVRSIMRIH